jgi:hypothetical protein
MKVMESPVWNFAFGIIAGALIGMIVTLHIVTNQVQARNARLNETIDGLIARNAERIVQVEKLELLWKSRADTCEAKFQVGTIVYEKQDLATIPLMHGSMAFVIRDTDKGGARPSLYIPAQVDIYTDRPDVRYEWIDGRTGQSKGIFPATSSPSPSVPQ